MVTITVLPTIPHCSHDCQQLHDTFKGFSLDITLTKFQYPIVTVFACIFFVLVVDCILYFMKEFMERDICVVILLCI